LQGNNLAFVPTDLVHLHDIRRKFMSRFDCGTFHSVACDRALFLGFNDIGTAYIHAFQVLHLLGQSLREENTDL